MIVAMKKMVLVGHHNLKHKLFKELHKSKLVEIFESEKCDLTSTIIDTAREDFLNDRISRINSAFDFFKVQNRSAEILAKNTKKSADPFKFEIKKDKAYEKIKRMSFDEFDKIRDREDDIFAVVEKIEHLNAEKASLNSSESKILAEIESLDVYKQVDVPFNSFGQSSAVTSCLGYFPTQQKQGVEGSLSSVDNVYFEMFDEGKWTALALVASNSVVDDVLASLQNFEFTKTAYSADTTAIDTINNFKAQLDKIKQNRVEITRQSVELNKDVRDIKTLYDFYLVELEKCKALYDIAQTKKSFVLSAWYAGENENTLKALLDQVGEELYVEFREADPDDVVPTFVKSSKIIDPYQDITNMYSVPNYRGDFDPNPIMAFFYFLFFGMMMADAGYGLVLAIAGFAYYKYSKPVKGKGRLLLIIAMGGISTAIWGILFGGYFGLEVGGTFLDSIKWFSPLDEPLLMLGLCLGLGFVHMLVGMIINIFNLVRHKRAKEAFFSTGTWLMMFAGLGLIACDLLFAKTNIMIYAGIGVAGLGAVLLMYSNTFSKKGAKKVLGFVSGVGKLYDGVNILSDVLSYARIFGLGLSGGVVAMVVNQICIVIIDMLGIPALGYVICIPIFMFGHLFNIGISTLGAYVHNCRLQYIEYYGKFYQGAGHLFVPFGSNTKYTYLDM